MALNENFATVWEAIADTLGDAPALSHGPLTRTWAELDDRAARFAGAMADAGVGAGSDDGGAKVGMALYNGPAYTEATFGAFKARAVPFNVNYRYRESELAYLLTNADCEVVVAHPELVDLNQGGSYMERQVASYAKVATSSMVMTPVIARLGLAVPPGELARDVAVS